MKKLVIFGSDQMAEVAAHYFKTEGRYQVSAFSVDGAYIKSNELFGKPVIAFEDLEKHYSPDDADVFIAIGYRKMNRIREAKFNEAKKRGYYLPSYICPSLTTKGENLDQTLPTFGENCFVLGGNHFAPFTSVGDGATLWFSNLIGHHVQIGKHCYLSGQVTIAGGTILENRCFAGMHASISDGLVIGEGTLIGAHTFVSKSTKPGEIYAISGMEPRKARAESVDF